MVGIDAWSRSAKPLLETASAKLDLRAPATGIDKIVSFVVIDLCGGLSFAEFTYTLGFHTSRKCKQHTSVLCLMRTYYIKLVPAAVHLSVMLFQLKQALEDQLLFIQAITLHQLTIFVVCGALPKCTAAVA